MTMSINSKSIEVVFELLPILLSYLLLKTITTKSGFFSQKIKTQMRKFENFDEYDQKHVSEVVEDAVNSTGFIASIFSILLAVLLMLGKEFLENSSISVQNVEVIGLFTLLILYLIALIRLFSMKGELICRECKFFLFKHYTYDQLFKYSLYFGYICLVFMVFM